jgi:hypothetical protein
VAIGLLNIGCANPAQFVWSPDGSRAAYSCAGKAYLVAADGAVLQTLGDSAGGMAWTRDGQRLYFATAIRPLKDSSPDNAPADAPPAAVKDGWFAGPAPHGRPKSSLPAVGQLNVLEPGQAKPRTLCALPGVALHVSLSPDEKWLAALIYHNAPKEESRDGDGDSGDSIELYAVSLATNTLYAIACPAGFGGGFTGPHTLAYVQADAADVPKKYPAHAKLVEITLDESHADVPPPRKTPPFTLPGVPMWIRPLGADLLMLVAPKPAASANADDTMPPLTLYRVSREGGGKPSISELATDLEPVLSVSPGGTRLLVVRSNHASAPSPTELVVMNPDGGRARVIRTSPNLKPLWPSWRDDRHIVLPSEKPVEDDAAHRTKYFAAEEYEIGDDGNASLVRALSKDWDHTMLPFEQDPQTATPQPAPVLQSPPTTPSK